MLLDCGLHELTSFEQILLKLSGNILDHPGEDKYSKFKPTNQKIKEYLVDPQGTLEYAVEVSIAPPDTLSMVLILGDRVPLDGLQTRGKHGLMSLRTTPPIDTLRYI